jgi:putative ABC transport system ATP-binding protein
LATPALKTANLSHRVGNKYLVREITAEFCAGQIYTIIGPSGAGKSSFMRLLNRLDEPTSGEVIIDGVEYHDLPPTDLRRKVGYLFQTPVMFDTTIRDNFHLADPALTDERINELLKWSAAGKLTPDKQVTELSTGEAQRVAIARLLACQPQVALLDEPTSALDPTATVVIEKLIRHLALDHNLVVLVVTHNPEQALRLGGKTLLMVDGCLIEQGPAEQVINQPRTPEGLAFRNKELS